MKRQTPALRKILEVSNLQVRRGSARILEAIRWTVRAGEHWVILGANGSGKTSLLSALTGYLTPSEGTIMVLSHRYGASDWRELRKRIGLVSSALAQMAPNDEPAWQTVVSGKYAMIDFWGKARKRDRRRALAILQDVGCQGLAEREWIYLSQGERQRVLIARALMSRPALLILDEPCAGLDPVARERFLQFLGRVGRKRPGPVLVLVTHHVEEIMPVFSHVLLLRRGAVLFQGPKRQALSERWLSRAFGAPLQLRRLPGPRLAMRIRAKGSAVL